jgi:hypothetical protein
MAARNEKTCGLDGPFRVLPLRRSHGMTQTTSDLKVDIIDNVAISTNRTTTLKHPLSFNVTAKVSCAINATK